MPKQAFHPIADLNSKILILGTMPGESSIKKQQYYGHGANHFWKIIFSLFEQPLSQSYEERKQLLAINSIALWDVLESCEGKGSSDSNIKNEKPNDFVTFYSEHPLIKTVFLTSGKAEKFYDKYIGKRKDLEYILLPSPSPQNKWKTFEEKVQEWEVILKHL